MSYGAIDASPRAVRVSRVTQAITVALGLLACTAVILAVVENNSVQTDLAQVNAWADLDTTKHEWHEATTDENA
eukprot:CAMPEP_0114555214 /NCGR_PEP_ID=MMETSP0114-20121206/8630_1 /TAXON_ID=31324 /ORGANISM="Goniomonas sp, Strain m" /LENGTH=73 /DNA_ID=CAMNT_0001740325 /DNA_START=31 /DNA_END=248 /DNA_ORIENTATION=+